MCNKIILSGACTASAIVLSMFLITSNLAAQPGGNGSELAPYEYSASGTLTDSEPVRLTVGQSIFLQFDRNGGTGYFWQPAIEDSRIIKIDFVRSVQIKKSESEKIVGQPEADIFRLTAKAPGSTIVSFNLARVRSTSITSLRLSFNVSPKS